jgi:hypothetical protein
MSQSALGSLEEGPWQLRGLVHQTEAVQRFLKVLDMNIHIHRQKTRT